MFTALIRILFAPDPMARMFATLLNHRRLALHQHEENRRLAQELVQGQTALYDHKMNYTVARNAVEAAYNLELD